MAPIPGRRTRRRGPSPAAAWCPGRRPAGRPTVTGTFAAPCASATGHSRGLGAVLGDPLQPDGPHVHRPGTGTPGPTLRRRTGGPGRTCPSCWSWTPCASSSGPRRSPRTSPVMLGRPPPAWTDRPSMHPAWPLSFHAAADRSDRPLADFPQPQQRCLLAAEGLKLGGLGPPPLPERRPTRVIAGAGSPGLRLQRRPAAEPGSRFQQAAYLQIRTTSRSAISQVVQDWWLPRPPRRACRRRPGTARQSG